MQERDTAQALPVHGNLTREYLLHHQVCPIGISEDGLLLVAAAEGALVEALDDIQAVYDREARVHTVLPEELERLIERRSTQIDRLLELSRDQQTDDGTTDVRDLASQEPVVRYVNLIVRDAYDAGASDIHLESGRDGMTVRFRVDGILVPASAPQPGLHQAVVSRIKLLAELDIAERRRPQDGRIRVRLEDRELDIRVSTVPTIFGESVVLRLLNQGGRPVFLAQLGMSADMVSVASELASRPHGMLLVTGPTGSGKTSTLYSMLTCRSPAAEKVITIEDPVEYQLPGITQVPVHSHVGVSFGSALRAILRQDPDVLMVGEMRDRETAEVAVQAAMTGHLVLATLHTNDAVGAFHRLLDLGLPHFMIAATVEAVLAQRLVRCICRACAVSSESDARRLQELCGSRRDPSGVLRGTGCRGCGGTGYRGRTGLFELLVATTPFRQALAANVAPDDLRRIATSGGFRSLRDDGWDKVAAGVTTIDEVLRATEQ